VNPYDVLQVSPLAEDGVIKAAYRSLMQRYHPDRNPGDEQAAQAAVRITQAYELLADPARRAAYDAQRQSLDAAPTQAAGQVAPRRTPIRKPASKAQPPSEPKVWILRAAAFSILAIVVFSLFRLLPTGAFSGSPVKQLTDIRAQIESAQTSEAVRRDLFARKQSLLEQHPDLMRAYSTERVDDLAARSMSLLSATMTFSLSPVAGVPSPPVSLIVPEMTLVLGSFDADRLRDHIKKHRQRILDDLTKQIEAQPVTFGLGADVEARFKRVVTQSLMASLETPPNETYPSTYFESPGRHGVVQVILPQGVSVLSGRF
jgi:curved DNA-binding protein CbpA